MVKKLFSIGVAGIMGLCLFCGCRHNFIKLQEEEKSDMIILTNWFFTSGVPNNMIEVNGESDSIFEISISSGKLWNYTDQTYQQVSKIKSEESVRWEFERPENTYVDIIEWLNDNVIGYSVIEILFRDDRGEEYQAMVKKSVRFSKSNGEYLNVTKDQVQDLIDQCKK